MTLCCPSCGSLSAGESLEAVTAAVLETGVWAIEALTWLLRNSAIAQQVLTAIGDGGIAQALVDACVAMGLPLASLRAVAPALVSCDAAPTPSGVQY